MKYFKKLNSILADIEASYKSKILPPNKAISKIIDLIICQAKKGNKIILIGNGGSASIASHIATDFLKNANIPALAFADSSLITCISNDFGYEHVFEKPIEAFSERGDILFAISSSGMSKNILMATKMAIQKGCLIVTLSGFKKSNPLRKMGNINLYIPSGSYGYVEIIHLIICHLIVDYVKRKRQIQDR